LKDLINLKNILPKFQIKKSILQSHLQVLILFNNFRPFCRSLRVTRFWEFNLSWRIILKMSIRAERHKNSANAAEVNFDSCSSENNIYKRDPRSTWQLFYYSTASENLIYGAHSSVGFTTAPALIPHS